MGQRDDVVATAEGDQYPCFELRVLIRNSNEVHRLQESFRNMVIALRVGAEANASSNYKEVAGLLFRVTR